MTGLRVVEVNVFVQSVVFEAADQGSTRAAKRKDKPKEKEAEAVVAEVVEPDPPRVK